MGVNPDEVESSSNEAVSRHGITSAISNVGPSDQDLRLTDQLEICLRQNGLFEDDVGLSRRMEVLRKINGLVNSWIKSVSLQKVRENFYPVSRRILIEFFLGPSRGSCRNRWWKSIHFWILSAWCSYFG